MRKNLLLLVGSIVLTLLFCEALLRMIGYERTTVTPLTGFHEYSQKLGWKLIPNNESRFLHRDFSVEIKTNSDGFRDDEYDHEKAENTFRVVSLGDSFTWGWGVENDQVYMQVAEKLLDGVEFINMGQNGYGTGQELLLFELAGKSYSPDLVTVGFFKNDLDDNVAGRGKPLFDVVDGELKITEPPASQSLELRVKSFLVKNSYLFVLANYGYERIVRWFKQRADAHPAAVGSPEYSKEYEAEVEKKWMVFEKLTSKLKREANDKLMIIYIPDRSEVEGYKETGDGENEINVGDTRAKIRSIAVENNIMLLDLTEKFRESDAAGEKLYFEHDAHMSKVGHQRAGEALAEKLRNML